MQAKKQRKNFYIVVFLAAFAAFSSFGEHLLAAGIDYSEEDVWLVDSRSVSPCRATEESLEKLRFYRLEQHSSGRCRLSWEKASLEEFLATNDPSRPTVILVQGTHFSLKDDIECGLYFHKRLLANQNCRLVIWSWPSEGYIGGFRQDYQIKARYAEVQGQYIAYFLKRFEPESLVSLVGFSYGAKSIVETVEHLRRESPAEDGSLPVQCRNFFIAPAIDQWSIIPGRRYGQTLGSVEKSLVIYNPIDKALKFYPMIFKFCGGPQALGRSGVPFASLTQDVRDKIQAIDISFVVGRRHEFFPYFNSQRLNQEFSNFLLYKSP